MKFLHLSVVTLATLLTLTACGGDKSSEAPKEDVKTEAKAEPATEQSSAGATAMPGDIDKLIIKSPYMDFVVNSNRAVLVKDIKSEFQLTPEQHACLLSLEGNPSYLTTLEPYVNGILSGDDIKEADEFFASDAGRKLGEAMLQQLGAENLPPLTEPTAEEKAEIAKAMLKPFFVKMKAKQDAMSEEEAVNFMVPMVQKEMERCKVS